MPHKLDVFQSMWAMEQRHPDGQERTVQEQVQGLVGSIDGCRSRNQPLVQCVLRRRPVRPTRASDSTLNISNIRAATMFADISVGS